MTEHRPGTGIGGRLLVAMALVIVTAALAAWLVAGAVGPALFHRHMAAAESSPGSAVQHAESAFASASTVTFAVALVAAVLTALVASLVLARRIGGSLGSLARAAAQVATGRFDGRLGRPRIGAEFDDLVDAFNTMADRLEQDEDRRRRLMADVTHELRTPVATIVASLDALEDGVQRLPQVVEVLRDQSVRLTRLTADLAAVTHAESGALRLDRRPVEPAALVRSVLAGAQARADHAGVEIAARSGGPLPPLEVDADRIGQVLANLVDNAIRHTPPGGRVIVAADPSDTGVRLTVSDTGEGIAPEHLPHVFERFYRADAARDREHGGSGIGLAIAQALVQAHGGTIAAYSAGAGCGSRFVIELPAGRVRSPTTLLQEAPGA